MRNYELFYIAKPDLDAEALAANSQRIAQFIASSGGQVSETKPWGKRRLAYAIRGHRDGHYTLVKFQMESQKVRELERNLKLTEEVIRHLLVSAED